LYVPKLKYNWLSTQQLCHDNDCKVGFDSSSVYVKDKAQGKFFLKVPVMATSTLYTLTSPFLPVLWSRLWWCLAPLCWSLWV